MALIWIVVMCLAACVGIIAVIHLVVPLLRGLGSIVSGLVFGIGWIINHVFEFVGGMIGDTVRFIGSIPAMIVLAPMSVMSVVFGRWSAAAHYAASVKREAKVAAACIYRIALRRPLKLVGLHGLLEGVEQRVPEAMLGAPGADKPKKRAGQFDGYTIVGSLRGGGSGAKLFVAEPNKDKRRQLGMPEKVVIKSFVLTDGSSLPQIIRESRALEAARQLGLVLDHDMDPHRFFYVMPYHPGDHLGIITREQHGMAGGDGLGEREFATLLRYTRDLLSTLSAYHKAGLWHKDVKPENVIVHDNRAHVVDLGLVTPLRSAMTLTTHGTEYFRDPEMVRQALQGVKVHQVDGAKFDIYAAGAVMYFVIENTFPAHGGLSRFHKKSPESVRWIIRRAMADYHKRYASMDEMLSDLDYVLAAADPYEVKPVALPSMQGPDVAAHADMEDVESGPEVEGMPEPEVVGFARAGSPVPPTPDASPTSEAPPEAPPAPPRDKAFRIGLGAWAVKLEKSGDGASDETRRKGRRPRLRMANWWTGAYEVEDPGEPDSAPAPGATPEPGPVAAAAMEAERAVAEARDSAHRAVAEALSAPEDREQARAFRRHARTLRRQAREASRKVRRGTMTARRAASEQRRAARERAAEMRSRILKRRGKLHPDRELRKAIDRHDLPREGRRPLGVLLMFTGVALAVVLVKATNRGIETIDMNAVATSHNPIIATMPSSRLSDRRRWLVINEADEAEDVIESWADELRAGFKHFERIETNDADTQAQMRRRLSGSPARLVSAIRESEYDGIILITRNREDEDAELMVRWIDSATAD